MPNKIKSSVEERYGSINKFIEEKASQMRMSRTHMYKLLNGEDVNPTLETLRELAELTEIPIGDILNEYSMRYRDGRLKD